MPKGDGLNMGVMDKFLNAMRLNGMEDEYEDDYYDEGEIIDNTVRKPVLVRDDEEYDDSYDVKPEGSLRK